MRPRCRAVRNTLTELSIQASGWIRLLVLFGIVSTVEAFTVSHVFRFMPLYLGTVHVPPAEVPALVLLTVGAVFLGAATATAVSMVFALLATAVPEERRATTLNLVLLLTTRLPSTACATAQVESS